MTENDDNSRAARELAASRASLSEIATELARAAAATTEPPRKQDDLPGRSDAFLRLVEIGLKAKK
jgi:hypothetical protein